ncbi:MAG: glycerophosphodiester phosphodiesterase [Gemmatimonadaceae bacterium]
MNVLLDPAARLVIAHRGNSAFFPENTLESFEQAVALGVDALECDVRVSSDGKAVVMHDPTLDRTTNGTGPVGALTLDELQRLDGGFCFTRDGGRTFPFRGRGIRIPAFELVLSAFANVPMIVEVKTRDASAEVRRLIERSGATGRVVVGAFDDAAIAPFRGTAIAHSASRRELIRLFGRALLPGSPPHMPYQALAIPPRSRGVPLPVQRFARMARHAGATTHVWTVDNPAQAYRYWAGAVNGIITNDPAAILASAGRANTARTSPSLSPVA